MVRGTRGKRGKGNGGRMNGEGEEGEGTLYVLFISFEWADKSTRCRTRCVNTQRPLLTVIVSHKRARRGNTFHVNSLLAMELAINLLINCQPKNNARHISDVIDCLQYTTCSTTAI